MTQEEQEAVEFDLFEALDRCSVDDARLFAWWLGVKWSPKQPYKGNDNERKC